jgi:hypothetical protein
VKTDNGNLDLVEPAPLAPAGVKLQPSVGPSGAGGGDVGCAGPVSRPDCFQRLSNNDLGTPEAAMRDEVFTTYLTVALCLSGLLWVIAVVLVALHLLADD